MKQLNSTESFGAVYYAVNEILNCDHSNENY